MPIVLLDNLGYDFYRSSHGRSFFGVDDYDVRLVTDLSLLDRAVGPELETVVGVTVHDEDALLETGGFLCETGDARAAAVVAVSESLLLPAARLRAKLGYHGQSVAEATRFRDKVAMKETVRQFGIRVPEFDRFSPAAAHALLRRHGRTIVKPRLGTGSMGISVLSTAPEVEKFIVANESWLDEFEVEEFVAGQQYHVDSVVDQGRVVAATAGRTIDLTTSFMAGRPCRDVGVDAGPLSDALLDFNRAVVSCFPTFSGVTHHEVFNRQGELVFCEIAARPGGGGIVPGFESRTGVDLREVAVRAQLNVRMPPVLPVARHLTGYVLIYAGPGVLRGPVEPVRAPWVINTNVLAAPGTRLGRPRHWADAIAIVTVRGDTEQEVTARLDEVVAAIRPDIDS